MSRQSRKLFNLFHKYNNVGIWNKVRHKNFLIFQLKRNDVYDMEKVYSKILKNAIFS